MAKKIVKYLLYIIFLGSIIGAVAYYVHFYRNQGKSDQIYEQMEQVVEEQEDMLHEVAEAQIEQNEDETETETEELTYLDLQTLKEQNEDVYAWIEIPDTAVNYPVLQSIPDNYYLMHNMNASYGYPGCIYSNAVNGTDFESEITVLYGHNMKNETMFGSLYRFRTESYFEENPYVYIYTQDQVRVYEIMAVKEWSDNLLLNEYCADSTADKEAFLGELTEESCIQFREVVRENDSKVLVLSTCIRGKSGKRLLIVGVSI